MCLVDVHLIHNETEHFETGLPAFKNICLSADFIFLEMSEIFLEIISAPEPVCLAQFLCPSGTRFLPIFAVQHYKLSDSTTSRCWAPGS